MVKGSRMEQRRRKRVREMEKEVNDIDVEMYEREYIRGYSILKMSAQLVFDCFLQIHHVVRWGTI